MRATAQNVGFTPRREEQLLLHCARVQLDSATRQQIESLLHRPLDVDYLVRSARWHGIAPLLHQHVGSDLAATLPVNAVAPLKKFCSECAVRTRTLARELAAITTLFETHGIRALAYKGPTLAVTYYGDVTLRTFGDLDMIVHDTDLPACSQLLRERGYIPQDVGATWSVEQVQQLKHEQTFARKEPTGSNPSVTSVELHWTIAQRRYVRRITAAQFWDRRRVVSIDGVDVPTLAPEDLLLVLCIHGAKNLWRQLKLVCDVSQILAVDGNRLDWPALLRMAQQLSCRRVLLLGLYLADDLLGAPLPDSIRRQVRQTTSIRLLATQVKSWIFRGIDPKLQLQERVLFRMRSHGRLRDIAYHFCSKLLN